MGAEGGVLDNTPSTKTTAKRARRPSGLRRRTRPIRWTIWRRDRLALTMTARSAAGTSMPSSSTRGAQSTSIPPAPNQASTSFRCRPGIPECTAAASNPATASEAAARSLASMLWVKTSVRSAVRMAGASRASASSLAGVAPSNRLRSSREVR